MSKTNILKNILFTICLFSSVISPIQAHSADVTLAWNKNSESNIAGYRVFARQGDQQYDFSKPDWEGSENQCTIIGLGDNTDYFFVVRAVSTEGKESRNSNQVYYNSVLKTFSSYSDKIPIADAGPDQVVGKNETILLNGLNSFDPDNGIVSYYWVQVRGTKVAFSNSAKAKVQFRSPEILKDETLVFQLTVTDTAGNWSSDSCLVTITGNNLPPDSKAGSVQTVSPGALVVLDGSDSVDPDDGFLDYQWVQLSGMPVELSNPNNVITSFHAPDIQGKGEALLFELRVTDRGGLFATDTVIVNVTAGGIPPVLETTSGLAAFAGDTVFLNAIWESNPSDEELSYRWKQMEGSPVVFSETNTMAPSFVAPQTDNHEMVLGFMVFAENGDGLIDTAEITVTVRQKEGASGLPHNAIPITSAYGDLLGVKIEGDGSLTRIEALLPAEMNDSDIIPESIIYGFFEIEVRVARPGDQVWITFFLPEIALAGCKWVSYSKDSGGYADFSENVSFNFDRDQLIMTLKDGGSEDKDNAANRIMIDPSGLAVGAYRNPSGVSSDDGSSGGCFIGTGIEKGSVNNPHSHEVF